MRSFTSERRAFNRLRADCTVEAQQEYELAISTLVKNYNTTIYENRFVVGGAVEVFTYALLRSTGIDCIPYGDQARSGDILLPGDKKLSIKSTFRGITNVKLINQMGEGEREWETATLFIVSGIGIVYGDPNMLGGEYIRATGDGVELRANGLRALVADDRNVLQMGIEPKPATETTAFSQKASTAVARQILADSKLKTLLEATSLL